MSHLNTSWQVRNLLVKEGRLYKLTESIVNLHTRLLRPSTQFRPSLKCIHHCSRVVNNAREYLFPLPLNFQVESFCLRQLTT